METRWNCLALARSWSQKLDFEGLTRAGSVLPVTVGNRLKLKGEKDVNLETEIPVPRPKVRGRNPFGIQLPN